MTNLPSIPCLAAAAAICTDPRYNSENAQGAAKAAPFFCVPGMLNRLEVEVLYPT